MANEIYAADGYGNRRVAVLDGDTGEIKRVWGAYGKPPTDDKRPPYNPDAPQFANPVHCVTLGKDGLVYVCDRSNNRVQVFGKDGSFVRQYVIDPQTQGPGSAWGLAFSPLDRKQNYFVLIDGTNNVLETVRRRDGVVVGSFGRPGRETGEFHWVHAGRSTRVAIFIPARSIPESACKNGRRRSDYTHRQDHRAAFAETDPRIPWLLGVAAEDDLVAVFDESTLLAPRQRDRFFAAGGDFEQAALTALLRPRHGA